MAAIAAAWFIPMPVAADADTHLPRLSLGADLDLIVGPDLTVDGRRVSDSPGGLPLLHFFARFEVPISSLFVLGARTGVSFWPTEVEERLGQSGHTTFDVGLFPKLCFPCGGESAAEWSVAVPFGFSFDDLADATGGPPGSSASSAWDSGFHVGLLGGYQFAWSNGSTSGFFEAGFVYRRIERTDRYDAAGTTRATSEHVRYQPISLLAGGGVIFKL